MGEDSPEKKPAPVPPGSIDIRQFALVIVLYKPPGEQKTKPQRNKQGDDIGTSVQQVGNEVDDSRQQEV